MSNHLKLLRKTFSARDVYRASSPAVRRQVYLTGVMALTMVTVAVAHLMADGQPAASASPSWVTPQNIVTVISLGYGLGMLRQQFKETKRRLEKLEDFIEDDLPQIYVRKDVHRAGRVRGTGD